MTDEDLETIISDLLERYEATPEGSAARRFLARQLTGLRYSREEAGPIIECLNYFGDWFANPRVLDHPTKPPRR
jgi:hypothetical protein